MTCARIEPRVLPWAECGGYLWLCTSLDDVPMAGAGRARATMTDRLTLGYRTATPTVDTPVGGGEERAPRARVPLLDGRPARRRSRTTRFERERVASARTRTLLASLPAPAPRRHAGGRLRARGERGERPRRGAPSVVDALLRADALLVRVLDVAHVGDGVGDLDELGGGVAAGAHDVDVLRPVTDRGEDLGRSRSSPSSSGR